MRELILKTLLEGLGLGVLLVLVCAVSIRKGAVAWYICTVHRCRRGAWHWG